MLALETIYKILNCTFSQGKMDLAVVVVFCYKAHTYKKHFLVHQSSIARFPCCRIMHLCLFKYECLWSNVCLWEGDVKLGSLFKICLRCLNTLLNNV